ncbi:gustatory receptor-like 65a [Drosophila kikkawai]|uniref:Gustatory receptor-like 65a n=1 Tax=Drosophila kikkawai TaxID=30033 RepID=A0A6P4IIB5_DROKI|nr:uncharacterized protein CG32395 [Drosophila kikkawai]
MREVNFVNRRTRQLLFLILAVTQLCGITTCVYSFREKSFRPSSALQIYGGLILSFVSLLLYASFSLMLLHVEKTWPLLVGTYVMLAVRVQGFWASKDLVRLLNELLEVVEEVNVMARHPNIFRLRHLLLLILGLQNLLRCLLMLADLSLGVGFVGFTVTVLLLFLLAFLLTFLLQITINLCLLVVLIASYNELHRCTRRISNDLDSLRQSRVLESGQFLVLVKQLHTITEELIQLRVRIFQLTQKIIEHFRFHWLCGLVYGLIPFYCFKAINVKDFYYLGISALNLIFHCTVFRILSWESRTTRSFCHFQMSNYHQEFDRTIDILLHQEIRQHLKVSIYKVTLDTKFLLRLLSLCAFWVFVNRQGYLLLHRNIV